ncbi:hypothetical protein CC2G_004484 [Coprinopsis cinerea AmutBmut pab1-1]|nr:hypothetical protein CC2G_004484 [Coprinopsis cinerea AmutBmut pab1-1]
MPYTFPTTCALKAGPTDSTGLNRLYPFQLPRHLPPTGRTVYLFTTSQRSSFSNGMWSTLHHSRKVEADIDTLVTFFESRVAAIHHCPP